MILLRMLPEKHNAIRAYITISLENKLKRGLKKCGLTFLIAAIINYIKRDEVRGTWLESHFRWQIRTFWFCLLWGLIGAFLSVVLIGYFILLANGLWVIYRIAKGWINVADNKPMYGNS